MSNASILGLHHITAIAGDAQRNYDFYTKVLGLRLVKKTVNFDDPGTYHFYYGNEIGSPGTILTFFPWVGIQKGRTGTGMATEIAYAVPKASFEFWQERFNEHKVTYQPLTERFGRQVLAFEDPDGLLLNFTAATSEDERQPWATPQVAAEYAPKGFDGVVLTLQKAEPTIKVLTELLGYTFSKQEKNSYRFVTENSPTANVVDIVEEPNGQRGINAGGTNHHIAFRVKDDNILMEMREKVAAAGIPITEKIDRNYFYSLYFREPGGVLFEIASDNPGFAIDEQVNELGTHLMLPLQYEPARKQIEEVLPTLTIE